MDALIPSSAPLAVAELPADQQPALVYLASLGTERSRRTQRQALRAIAAHVMPGTDERSFPWHQLRYQHTTAIRAWLQATYAPATANKMLSALRRVIEEARRLGLMSADVAAAAADVKRIKATTLPRGRALSAGELAALLDVCMDGTPGGARDAAIIAMGYVTGMRRGEIVALDLANWDASTGGIFIHAAKGHKDRMVYLETGATAALDDWLAVRGLAAGPLFYPIDKSGRMSVRRMSDQAIFDMYARRGAQANVKAFSPHDMRRTFISDLLDRGGDIATVQKLAGHSNPETTARYDRRGEEAKQKAARLLHVPYKKP